MASGSAAAALAAVALCVVLDAPDVGGQALPVSGVSSSSAVGTTSMPPAPGTPSLGRPGTKTVILQLEPIQSRELFEGPTEVSSGTLTVDGRRTTGAATALQLASAQLATTVVRRLPALWQLRLAPDARPADLQVSYELLSSQGHRDRLSHQDRPDLEVHTRVWPLAPEILEQDSSGVLVQGGVVLEMDVESVVSAGTYEGTLTVSLHQL